MAKKDYYAILGVSKTASQDEIKSAYRKIAKQYHPDLHPDDKQCAEKFKECNEAYEILGDPERRRKYDSGEMDFENFNFGGPGRGFSTAGFEDIFDIFSSFMGGGSRSSAGAQRQTPRGSDVTCSVNVSFLEAALGASKEIKLNRLERCPDCNGTGAKDSSSVKECDECHGTGRVQYVRDSFFGRQVTVGTCRKCGGAGKIVTERCKKCNGAGVVSKKKILTIHIPAGTENGAIMSINGYGNASAAAGGVNGNLLVIINVEQSKLFKRDDCNLYVDVPIPFSVAVNGGDVEIPTLSGSVTHRLEEGTANGETLRIRGKGIKNGRRTGDLFVRLLVEVPSNVDKTNKKQLAEFENQLSLKNYPKRKQYLAELDELNEKIKNGKTQ